MPVSESPISSKLEAARRELLDLSLRNPLLHYRPLKTRGVEIVNELPAEIFRILVKEGKAMSFLPIDSKTALSLLEQTPDPEVPFIPTPAQTDNKLQTKETLEKLQSRLLDTYHSARMFVEEQGVNILYLALGSLTWYETGNSDEGRQAPLILVPVELERTTAREQFQMRYLGAEIGSNLSLQARLKTDFGITLPNLPEAEELDVGRYFDDVWLQVVGRKGWVINSQKVSLGFFSFGKFMMYNDLDRLAWPATSQPDEHSILNALLQEHGFREPTSSIPDEAHLDEYVLPADTRQVVDADSSQTLAILDVNQGRNLVIQGPPGTGKSQTITNLIAEAIGKGKTVLFVAEKMAALEVVKRRLDKVGLGEACLELHSHKTNKKDLLRELQRTLDLGKPQLPGLESEVNLLTQIRARLNDYATAINTPVGTSGLTMYAVYGLLIQQRKAYAGIKLPRLALPSLLAWSRNEFKAKEALIEEVQARLAQMGMPKKLLFWGSQRRSLLPTEQSHLELLLPATQEAIEKASQAAIQLATLLQLTSPGNYNEASKLAQLSLKLQQSPGYRGINITATLWTQKQAELRSLLAAGTTFITIHQQHDSKLIPEAWSYPILPIRQDLLAYGDKWWRFVSGAYRRSKKALTGLTRLGLPKETSDQLALTDAILESQRQEQIINQGQELGQAAFGTQWRGATSDWNQLTTLLDWAVNLHQEVQTGKMPPSVLEWLAQEPDLIRLITPTHTLVSALNEQEQKLTTLKQWLRWEDPLRFGPEDALLLLAFKKQAELMAAWQSHPEELHQVVAWNILTDRLQEAGLQEITNLVLTWPEAGQYLTAAFRQTWYEALLEKAYADSPALPQFERAGHEEAIQKFHRLDHLLLAYNRLRLAAYHHEKLPLHQAGGQLGILRREFEKKARHLPIRQLMSKAGNAIQAIKPVFMMGPLSIANFLPPEALQFDLVIFDEASQVKPVDAFGAILRAKQVVVVGDSKQMPPTSFFDALVKEEEANEEENITADVESILGLFAAQGAPQRMLRWHYRSRHESLVTVSNHEFYENRLVIFPSPDANREAMGLIYRHLPHTFYDRGKTRTNPEEAATVAQAIMEHAKTQPGLTLGVAAFSMAQMQAIINQLELLRRQDPAAESFFTAHPNEPFFIKNLENVQGDERDVIFISIGYGRTQDGYLSMSFGPLNGTGGERRLNVLITRARLRCEVFTNLSPDDIDLERTQARGVQAFKTFLNYAKNGRLDVPVPTGRETESVFEEQVQAALTSAGYQVQAQVGSAGFFIDLAIVHPQKPGKYVLGIECDGANYHRARSARDRDRLRQTVLENLGWQIYRVWSTDWFRNPAAEQKRLLQAVEKALQQSPEPVSLAKSLSSGTVEILRETAPPAIAKKPEIPAYELVQLHIKLEDREIPDLPSSTLVSWVQQVVAVESPVHEQEVIRRIADAAEVPRIGPRLRVALETAIATGVENGQFRQQKQMLWAPDQLQPTLRDRGQLPASSKNILLIAPEEIKLAIRKVVGDSFGMSPEEVPAAVTKLLGLGRQNEDIREQVEMVLEQMVALEQLRNQEGLLVLLKA